MDKLSATIEGQVLVIRVPMNSAPVPSASGKTMVIASTHGNQTIVVNGNPVTIGVNAYVKR